MKGREAPWYLVALIVLLVALPVLASLCWPVTAEQKPAPTATPGSVFVIPTPEPTLPLVVTPPGRVHVTATPAPLRQPTPTPVATNVVIVPTVIPTLPPPTATSTPDVLPLDLPTPRPTPIFQPTPPYQLPRH